MINPSMSMEDQVKFQSATTSSPENFTACFSGSEIFFLLMFVLEIVGVAFKAASVA
jgi:hypothetical protein